MRYFNVRINVTRESYFDYDVEADSHEEAEEIAKSLVWDDALDDDLRQHAEIVDERYDAIQEFLCGECGKGFNENQMTDDEACPACNTPIPEEEFNV
jgi:rubrerythrin